MLRLSDISIHFSGNYLFSNLNLTVSPRDRIGLIGRNGAGKTTLLKIIKGLEMPESGNVITPKEYKIGYLQQDFNSAFTMTVFDEAKQAFEEVQKIDEKLENINKEMLERTDYESKQYMSLIESMSLLNERLLYLDAGTMDANIEQVLMGLGFLKNDFYKPANELSGGWQMRLELAKILLEKPDCILLDEPTNHLDIESIIWLEVFLKNYEGSVILVSHDRRFLDNITNRTVEIKMGKVYDMPYNFSGFVEQRELQRELEESAFKNQQKQIAVTERFIERFRSKSTLATRVQSRIKALERIERIVLEDEDKSKIKLHFPEPPRSGRDVVLIKGLSKSYGSNLVLNNIDLAIERGDKIAFVGKNGEGKSTLSRIIGGLETYQGHLEIGHNVEIAYFAQHQALMLDGKLNAFEVIDSAAQNEMRSQVRHLLGAFLFSGDDIYKKVSTLSGGEKSRLALAKLLLRPMNLLILDEPTNHLDMVAKDVLKNAILNYSGTLIVVSHDRDFLEGLTDKTYEFNHKKIKEYLGDISYFLEKKKIDSFYEYEQEKKEQKLQKEASSNKNEAAEQRQRQKAYMRDTGKLQKQIATIESEIEIIEKRIAELEALFENPDFFIDHENTIAKQQEYQNLNIELAEKMKVWEKYHKELEKVENEYDD